MRHYNILAKDDPTADVEVEINGSGTKLDLDNQGNWHHREEGRSANVDWEKVVHKVTSDSGTVSVTGHLWVPPSSRAPVHDDDGNLTSDGRWDYTWDARNQLVRMVSITPEAVSGTPAMSNHGHQQIDFVYDWMGRRISKKVQTTKITETSGVFTASTDTDHRSFLYQGSHYTTKFKKS